MYDSGFGTPICPLEFLHQTDIDRVGTIEESLLLAAVWNRPDVEVVYEVVAADPSAVVDPNIKIYHNRMASAVSYYARGKFMQCLSSLREAFEKGALCGWRKCNKTAVYNFLERALWLNENHVVQNEPQPDGTSAAVVYVPPLDPLTPPSMPMRGPSAPALVLPSPVLSVATAAPATALSKGGMKDTVSPCRSTKYSPGASSSDRRLYAYR